MGAGIPYIATNFKVWEDMIEDGKAGMYVEIDDIKNIIKGIRYILDNMVLAADMGREGRILVEQRYNWDIEKEKLLDCYIEISNNG